MKSIITKTLKSALITSSSVLLCALPLISHASGFLSPGKAFPLAVKSGRGVLQVRFSIAPGYALYRKRMSIQLMGAKNVLLGKTSWPKALTEENPFSGKELLYRGKVNIRIPFVCRAGRTHQVRLHIRFQGCADAGLCYPPIEKKIRVAVATQSC